MSSTQEHTTTHRVPRNLPAQTPMSISNGEIKPATADDVKAAAQSPIGAVVTIEIAGLEVTVPVRFAAGHVLTENQAKVLDAAYQRQFTNNQNAMAKARAEALGKATTDAERAAKAPLTATQLAALYTDYEPSIGGTPRQSQMEVIRQQAAWRFWTGHVAAHNKSVAAGGPPVIVKAGQKPVAPLTPKRGPDGKVIATVGDQRDAMTARLLAMPEYADRIQVQVDAILAERGSKTPVEKSDAVSLSADDLL